MAIGALLAGIASALAQNAATQAQTNLGYQNLAFQKQNARDQRQLATAGRTDAYGNRVDFDDVLNEWITQLTPTQQQLLKAGEREQLLSLTEDAAQNRQLRRQQFARSQQAGDVYDKLLADFLYEEPPSEESIRGDYQRLLGSEEERATREGAEVLGGQALRLGRGADIQSIIKNVAETLGRGAGQRAIAARTGAFGESQSRESAHLSEFLPALRQFAGIQDAVGQNAPIFSDVNQQVQGTQGEMLRAIASALGRESSQVGGALSDLADIYGNSAIDFGGIGSGLDSLFSKIGKGGGVTGSSVTNTTDPIRRVREASPTFIPYPGVNPFFSVDGRAGRVRTSYDF